MKITITDVTKRYGDVVALDGASLAIPSGSTVGVLGTNGAGKTTLFELLVGHDAPDEGSIAVGGLDVERAGHRVRERVGFLPEHTGFPDDLTGREVLGITARIRGIEDRRSRITEALELVGLADAADRRVEGYSNGMGRRLGLATALLARPPVLVLDEPTAGLDPRGVATFHEIVERIGSETDATIVLSSHVLEEVERLCDEVAVLHEGRLRAAGSVEALREATDAAPTVVVTPAGSGERRREATASIREALAPHGTVTAADGRVELAVDGEPLAAIEALEAETVDRFEVREPGLDAVFEEALAADADPEVVA